MSYSNVNAKCPRCGERAVPCQYAYRPGVWGLPEHSSPDESECEEIGDCEECGAKDWTDDEADAIAYSASELYEPPDPIGLDD